MNKTKKHTWAEIDLSAVKHNLKEIVKLCKQHNMECAPLMVIKANAYGHGVSCIGPLLQKQGIRFFGVSDVSEGINLRNEGIKSTILLFESTFVVEFVL